MRAKKVAIIGSSRFKKFHNGRAQMEALKGNMPLTCGFYHHVDMVPISDETIKLIQDVSAERVQLADEVYVVNVNGYIGKSTRELIELAHSLGKPIRYMVEPDA